MSNRTWRNRVVGSGTVDPKTLVPNPRNWRKHPKKQRRAMSGALDELGWVAPVVVNRTTGRLIDGHLRAELASAAGAPEIPVLYVELDESEELLALATLDPLGDLARRDATEIRDLIADVTVSDEDLGEMLQQLDRWAAADQEGTPENRGRNNLRRGKEWERRIAADIGGERVGQHGGKDDVQHPDWAIQAKVGGAFPERLWTYLTAIPREPGQGRAIVVGDAPGPGRKRRAVVLIEFEEWKHSEGIAPFDDEKDAA